MKTTKRKMVRAYDIGCRTCGALPHGACAMTRLARKNGIKYHPLRRFDASQANEQRSALRSLPPLPAPYEEFKATVVEVLEADTNMLLKASKIVQDRQKVYGDPYTDMKRAAMICSAIVGVDVRPEQMALIMQGIKISRACNGYHADNPLDGCGYWQVYDSCATHDRTLPKRSQS